ncbi:hypothetical protein V8E55_010128 [Tylopilus felleus]
MESSHLVLSLINLFLLGSPNEHVLCVQRVWVDDIFNQPRWEDFVTRLARHTIFSCSLSTLVSSPFLVSSIQRHA